MAGTSHMLLQGMYVAIPPTSGDAPQGHSLRPSGRDLPIVPIFGLLSLILHDEVI